MNFIYCQNPDSDEPIMMLDTHVGTDSVLGMGISGQQFSAELIALDDMGKKTIDIRINSPGGSVIDGFQIFSAMLKTKAKVNTHNMGYALSIAAVIFEAGRIRTMADYSLLMFHEAFSDDGKKDEMLDKTNGSIVTMIASRTGKTADEISAMMKAETWMEASEALKSGFCDSIEKSEDSNKPRLSKQNSPVAFMAAANYVNKIHSIKNQSSNMKAVYNCLDLIEGTTENAVVESINKLKNAKKNSEDKLSDLEKKMKDLKDALDEVTDKYNALKKKNDDEATDKKNAEAEDKKSKAKDLVASAVKAGKLKNEPASIEAWEKMAVSDLETVKNQLDGLAVNKTFKSAAEVISGTQNAKKFDPLDLGKAMAFRMGEIRNKKNAPKI